MMRTVCAVVLLSAVSALAEMVLMPYAVVPKETIQLFNGKDLEGWTSAVDLVDPVGIYDPRAFNVWRAADGEIRCTGEPFGYLMTQNVYANYVLKLEYRWIDKPVNSGIFIHKRGADDSFLPKCVEVQLQHGRLGDLLLLSKATSKDHPVNEKHVKTTRPETMPNVEKPAGEWNSVEVTVRGNTITVAANGIQLNTLEGVFVSAGHICLQSEGGTIAFRNITLSPLPN